MNIESFQEPNRLNNGGNKTLITYPKEAVEPAIHLNHVSKVYKTAAGEYIALKNIDMILMPGQFVSIIGKSGSGKSTLLNMITGIDHPTQGEVCVGGVDIYRLTESQRALWRGRNLGIVFQFFQLLPMLTLLENTMLPMDYGSVISYNERPVRAMELLDLVGLADQAHKLPAAVSSGQQQSAAIARSLANDSPLIVADEPTGNLDSRSAEKVISLFDELVSRGKTIVLVTHDPSITKKTHRNLIISDGEIINEVVAKSLPLLNHNQMLKATQLIERRSYEPGEKIIRKDQRVSYFNMIESGVIEVVLSTRRNPELTVARLGPGQFFGEIELMHGGTSVAAIRASADAPVNLLLLPRPDFEQLLEGSPLTRESLGRIVQARLNENRSVDSRRQLR